MLGGEGTAGRRARQPACGPAGRLQTGSIQRPVQVCAALLVRGPPAVRLCFDTSRLLIEHCLREARRHGCRKLVLDCAERNVPFYEKCGLGRNALCMARHFS